MNAGKVLSPLFVVLMAVGCGGSTSGTGGGGGTTTAPKVIPPHSPVAEADFPAKAAEALCPAMATCCQKSGFAYDQATCRTNAEASLRANPLTGAGNPNTTYSADNAGACIAEVQLAFQACGPGGTDATECSHVYQGRLPQGSPCAKSVECADPVGGNASCVNGICQPSTTFASGTPGVAGDPCDATCETTGNSSNCSFGGSTILPDGGTVPEPTSPKRCELGDGLYCSGKTRRCEPLIPAGSPCSYSDYCAAGSYCDGTTCVPQHASGPCSSSRECSSLSWCSPGGSGSVCTPRKPNGVSCTGSEECQSQRCSGGTCVPDVPVSAKSCAGTFN